MSILERMFDSVIVSSDCSFFSFQFFFFQAEDGIRDFCLSRGLGDVYKRQPHNFSEISDEIKNAVDYIVTARRDEIKESLPSSIIKLEADGTIKIIRE